MKYNVKIGDKEFEVEVEELGDSTFEVELNEKKVTLKMESLMKLPSKEEVKFTGSEVKSDVSGSVVKILVDEGEEVGKGQPLIVLEAMKMENEIVSPFTGTVGKILVSEGEKVDSGTVLIVITSGKIEPESKEAGTVLEAGAEIGAEEEGTPIMVEMGGVVTAILKSEGDEVSQGEPILVLEAMKMENPVDSPLTGVISKIMVNEGDKVAQGDILAYVK